jgi:hypothetical protein
MTEQEYKCQKRVPRMCTCTADKVNACAQCTYIPEDLAEFANALRRMADKIRENRKVKP